MATKWCVWCLMFCWQNSVIHRPNNGSPMWSVICLITCQTYACVIILDSGCWSGFHISCNCVHVPFFCRSHSSSAHRSRGKTMVLVNIVVASLSIPPAHEEQGNMNLYRAVLHKRQVIDPGGFNLNSLTVRRTLTGWEAKNIHCEKEPKAAW